MVKQLLLATLSLLTFSARASIEDEMRLIEGLLPKNQDIAQVAIAKVRGASIQELEEIGAQNYIIADINNDGADDILVIAEVKPKIENYETNKPCVLFDESPECQIIGGERSLLFYVGKNDSYIQNFINADIVRTADEGGVLGDPLQGLSMKSSGEITLSQYGGSAWSWGLKDTFLFYKNDLYVIGHDSSNSYSGDKRENTKSINLTSGKVVETIQKDGDSPVITKRSRIKVQPLIRAALYRGQEV